MNILAGAGGDINIRLFYPGREPMTEESKDSTQAVNK